MVEEAILIDTTYPTGSKSVAVKGSQMHYIEQGEGDPILFVHGIPTSCYLWRNIIPNLAQVGRCLAVDLIGMGRSSKPDIQYTVFEHIDYLRTFIETLNLKNITLVMHGWGSVIGFEVARQLQDRVKGLAFLEAHVRVPENRDSVSLPVQELTMILDLPDGGFDVVMNSNYFVNRVLPRGCLRNLSSEQMQYYREPFIEPGSAKPLWQYLQDVPLSDDDDCEVTALINNYSHWLQSAPLPKLMMYAIPGFVTCVSTIAWAKRNLSNLQTVDIGECLHYAQESNPYTIANELRSWYEKL